MRTPTKKPQQFGDLIQAAFERAARLTAEPAAQARIAAEMIGRILQQTNQTRLAAMLS